MRFHNLFAVASDPEAVTLQMDEPAVDYSAAEALKRVTGLYEAAGLALGDRARPGAERGLGDRPSLVEQRWRSLDRAAG